jgi:DNA-binding GntR family transcriptional regulator
MTATEHPELLTDAEIESLAASPKPSGKVAASIARSIKSGKLERGAAIDSNADLARQHDCSPSAAATAKSLLAARGLLRKEGQFYVVACG